MIREDFHNLSQVFFLMSFYVKLRIFLLNKYFIDHQDLFDITPNFFLLFY